MKTHNFIIGPTDTDSISFSKHDMSEFSDEEIKKLVQELNDISPEFIEFENDGYYQSCIALKAKNYVLYDGKKKTVKGSAFKTSSKEPVLKEFMETLVEEMLHQNRENILIDIYIKYINEAYDISDIKKWCVKKTVTKAVLNPERVHEQKPYNAIQQAIKAGIIAGVQEGDKMLFYQAIDGLRPKVVKGEEVINKKGELVMIENDIMKVPELWSGDHDKWHYVERVYDTLTIFDNILDMSKFEKYHLKSKRELLCQT